MISLQKVRDPLQMAFHQRFCRNAVFKEFQACFETISFRKKRIPRKLARDSDHIFRSFVFSLQTDFSQVFSQITALVLPQAAEG